MKELAPQDKDGSYSRPSYTFTSKIGNDTFPVSLPGSDGLCRNTFLKHCSLQSHRCEQPVLCEVTRTLLPHGRETGSIASRRGQRLVPAAVLYCSPKHRAACHSCLAVIGLECRAPGSAAPSIAGLPSSPCTQRDEPCKCPCTAPHVMELQA